MTDPTNKAPTQRDRILALLRDRGLAGVSNRELNEVGFRYGGRLHELRRQGFEIRTVCEGAESYRYILVREPDQPKLLLTKQIERETLPLFAGVR